MVRGGDVPARPVVTGGGVPAGVVVPAVAGVVVLGEGEPVPADPWWDVSVPADPGDPGDLGEPGGPGGRGEPGVTVGDLVGTRAGADLAFLVGQVDRQAADDGLLVELVAACERVGAWAHGLSALAAGVLARRVSMSPRWSPAGGVPSDPCVAGDELALRLAWSRRAASRLVRDGRAFTGALAPTGDALVAGRVDRVKARILVERLDQVGMQAALAVQAEVLPGADRRTPTQLAADTDRALLGVDPVDAADRVARARSTRRVDHPRRLPDGMAGVWAVLPAAAAVLVDTTLDTTARGLRTGGDPRTLDQLRADTLTGLILHTPHPGTPHPTGPRPGTSRPVRSPVHVHVTVGLSTLLGVDEEPADLAGYGPIPATQARALAAGGIWRRIITDPMTGTVLDVGRTRYTPPAGLARHVRTRDHTCARPGCPTPATACDLDHTLEYHPDPHQPTRDGTPPTPGTTSADNLEPLCRRDHRLKTDGGHHLTQPTPGTFEWTTPTGHTYHSTPGINGHTQITHIPGTTPHPHGEPGWPTQPTNHPEPDDDPPPF